MKGIPHRQSGAVAVEFALLAPYLIALLLMTVEFGRLYFTQQRVQMAAFDAARYISSRLPSVGQFDLDRLKNDANYVLRRRAQLVAVYGVSANTGTPILPNMTTDHVSVAFDDMELVLSSDNSTARQSLCRLLTLIGGITEFNSLFDEIRNSGYCSEIDGNLLIQIEYPYQPIFAKIPFVEIDTAFTISAQSSMRVF